MKAYGTTVGEALGFDGFGYDESRVLLLKRLVYHRLENGITDPVRVFIKREPHKQAKLSSNRFRLISAVSLVDTMTDRVMLGPWHRYAVAQVGKTPIMLGWAPVGGGAPAIRQIFGNRRTRALDKTAWDWSVSGWLVKDLLQLVQHFNVAPQWWHDWMRVRWHALFRDAVFEFSDRTQVQQPDWGIMKSGCYLTLLLNSLSQVYLHNLASKLLDTDLSHLKYVVMGDDVTIEDFPQYDEYARVITNMGFGCKSSKPVETPEFCGFYFPSTGQAVPAYWRKHVYIVTHTLPEKLPDLLTSYQQIYAYEEVMLTWVRKILASEEPSRLLPVKAIQQAFAGL